MTTLSARHATRPVLIVGAGPTGMTAAILLADRGVPSLIVDRWSGSYPQPRAVHLDDEVCRILGRMGVDEDFAKISRPARGLRLVDRDLKVFAEFARDDVAGKHGYPQANLFDQPDLEKLLRARMNASSLIDYRGGVEVVGFNGTQSWSGPLTVTVKDHQAGVEEQLEAEYLLGCDGATSFVRRTVGSSMTDLGFQQRWLVVDVVIAADLGQWDGVHQVCDRRRAITYLRVGEFRYRWEMQLLDGETKESYLTVEALLPVIAPWTADTPASEITIVRIAEFVYRAQVADRWRHGSVFLLGDAAHLTPPFIGQGVGAGLRDAQNLAWKLAEVIHGRLPADALNSYEAERRAHARSMIRTAIAIGSAMTGGGAMGEVLRRLVLPRAHLVPGLRQLLIESVSPRLRSSAIFGRRLSLLRRSPRSLAGTLVPNSLLGEGGRLDRVSHGFLFVTRVAPTPSQQTDLDRAGTTVVLARDHEDLGVWLRRNHTLAAIVRPDLAVMATGRNLARLVSLVSRASRRGGTTDLRVLEGERIAAS